MEELYGVRPKLTHALSRITDALMAEEERQRKLADAAARRQTVDTDLVLKNTDSGYLFYRSGMIGVRF